MFDWKRHFKPINGGNRCSLLVLVWPEDGFQVCQIMSVWPEHLGMSSPLMRMLPMCVGKLKDN